MRQLAIDSIIHEIETLTQISYNEMISKRRFKELVEARQISMYFLKKKTNMTWKEIGRYFFVDHSTAIYATKNIENFIETDKRIREIVDKLNTKMSTSSLNFRLSTISYMAIPGMA